MRQGWNRGRRALRLCALLATLAAAPAHAVTEIQWWHAMSGELLPVVEQLAADFNAQQGEYRIVPEYKGQYTQTMTAALFAMRSGQQPAIVQVNEVATATMMAAKGSTYPVFELMREQGVAFEPSAYLPAVSGYYTDASGNMLSFPFNASTPILYYNKDQFRLAGLDPETAPRTWPEVEAAAMKLLAAGMPCGFTTAWPSWVHIENLSAVHDLPIATQAERVRRARCRAHHQQRRGGAAPVGARRLEEDRYLRLWRPRGSRRRKIPRQPCGMYVTSSATRPDILANAKFEVGYGLMPYWPTGAAPQNSIIGGATLWVLKGRPDGRIPRRRAVLRVPVPTRDPGALAPGDRLSADHPRRLRAEPPAGLLSSAIPAPTSRSGRSP